MLVEDVKDILRSNQLVVVIGARGTGKTRCATDLEAEWRKVGLTVLRLEASSTMRPQDLDEPLAAALQCEPAALDAHSLPGDRILRVIIDRCDRLYDRPWLAEWQERWRALLSSKESEGRLGAVFLGRPLFREIAGGDSSPLLNVGPVITVKPLAPGDIQEIFDVDEACARAVWKKTGGHPQLTEALLDAIDRDVRNIGEAVKAFVEHHRRYLIQLIEDHSVDGRAVLGDLLAGRDAVHQGALIRRHFGGAHASGMEAIEDLRACGLIERTDEGDCRIGADLLRNMDGLRGFVRAPALSVPRDYDEVVMGNAWRLVFDAENRLRELVARNLSDLDSAWWMSHVPPELRGAAEGRQRSEGAISAVEEAPLHPIMYLTLGELFDLVYHNWTRVFGPQFGIGQPAVREAAAQFETLRHRIAHSRPVSEDQLGELTTITRRLGLA